MATRSEKQQRRTNSLFFIIVVLIASIAVIKVAKSHDSWISQHSLKNAAGEWCCGDYDCKTYDKAASVPQGWFVDGQVIPYDEALPIAPPDGVLVICKRPDGSRRCVIGLKPGI